MSGFFDNFVKARGAGGIVELSFKEKSIWALLAGLLLAFGLYFVSVLPAAGPDLWPRHGMQFVGAVLLLVVLQVGAQVILALREPQTRDDERDRLIALHGARAGGAVLAVAAFGALMAAVATEGNFVFAHVLLGGWVLAQAAEYAVCLWRYRRGF